MEKWLKVLSILGKYKEDFFILSGVIIIISTTYGVNKIAGSYLVGIICLLFGLLLARKLPKN